MKFIFVFITFYSVILRPVHASPVSYRDAAFRLATEGETYSRFLVIKTKKEFYRQNIQFDYKSRTVPMFSQIAKLQKTHRRSFSQLSKYKHVIFSEALTREEQKKVLEAAYQNPDFELAYFEPKTKNASMDLFIQSPLNFMRATGVSINEFESLQYYLNSAPEGVGAKEAWTIPGGTGKGIRVVDVENGWDHDHAEFMPTFWSNAPAGSLNHHGTAVWGEIAADRDGEGMTGISYDVEFGTAYVGFNGFSDYPKFISQGLEEALANMVMGDVIVIEQHAPMMSTSFAADWGPVEYIPAVFDILKAATETGIHCVAAAGNGYTNLDDPKYSGAFDLKVRDSGCILVGAAHPPSSFMPYTRCDFSDYGSRVDAFGYGQDVPTTGYGDLLNEKTKDGKSFSFTSSFAGTSSATPIVAGAVASVLGIAKAQNKTITPKKMREALRATGTPQQGNVDAERIGNLPNITELLKYLNL